MNTQIPDKTPKPNRRARDRRTGITKLKRSKSEEPTKARDILCNTAKRELSIERCQWDLKINIYYIYSTSQ